MPKEIPKQLNAWMMVVKQVQKENPGMPYKQVLQMAKMKYKK